MIQKKEKPLRFVNEDIYNLMVNELEKNNIHFFDVDATAIVDEDNLEISIRYGETFKHGTSCYFKKQALEAPYNDILNFFKYTTAACHRIFISEYFKMIMP
ncbi:hypothetical protein ACQ3HR_09675 [Staphylococcus cohnii]|uniref:hypothetical protein n=1 Tax=Staphylococcus cohnii TaxID=29382 RepID=UPI000E6A45FF|nr:hypothetical protein [Staphylococcus cohnii]RIL88932.1 hypothetical protein BUY32_09610 [Staphylococcus cohnii]